MNSLFKVCLLSPLLLVFTGKYWAHADSGPRGTDFPDAFKVFEIFEDTAAISDSNGDNILECLLGKRTTIDPDARTATFTWTINPQDGTLSEKAYFWVKAEGEPGHFTVFSNDGCLLGVQRELKDSVPQHCIDRFVTDCGADVPPHSRDLCYDGEGDY